MEIIIDPIVGKIYLKRISINQGLELTAFDEKNNVLAQICAEGILSKKLPDQSDFMRKYKVIFRFVDTKGNIPESKTIIYSDGRGGVDFVEVIFYLNYLNEFDRYKKFFSDNFVYLALNFKEFGKNPGHTHFSLFCEY